MFESIILGTVQGIAEWLPVSSEGLIVLTKNAFFPDGTVIDFIKTALFLHLGTFLAALVYFWKDVKKILFVVFDFKGADENNRKLFVFLLNSTLISGVLGAVLLLALKFMENALALTGEILAVSIGVLLLLTALLSFRTKENGGKEVKDLTLFDGVLLGLAQAATALPGLSRSGTTVAFLLMRGFKDQEALRLSFLMSLPIVLVANIGLNLIDTGLHLTMIDLVGLALSFLFGLLTIDWLIKIARKVQFAWFALIFGVLIIISVFIF